MAKVKQHAAVGGSHQIECDVKLFAAVATKRPQRFAGQTLGMQTHENGLVTCDLAVHEGDDLGLVIQAEDVDPQIAVPSRKRSGCFRCARSTEDHGRETKQEARQ